MHFNDEGMLMKTIILFGLVIFYGLLFALPSFGKGLYGERLCRQSSYDCVKVKRGQSWETLFPNRYERDVVRRLNRMNVRLYRGQVIAVPRNLRYLDVDDISPFPDEIDPPGEKLLIFNQRHLAWGAYDEDGDLVRWGPASGGQRWCSDVGRSCRTVNGDFNMHRKGGSRCKSSKYPLGKGGAPMPHCMFFYRGYGFHGSPQVPGYHASHGCVRLFNEDAEWLNKEFIDLPRGRQKGTRVLVVES